MPPDLAAGAATREIVIKVLRYRSETDLKPLLQAFRVPFTNDMSVLQGLQYIKDHLDGSLSFRWSCRMAICGSCGMMIGAQPKLACMTFLRDYYPGPLTVSTPSCSNALFSAGCAASVITARWSRSPH